MSGPSPSRRIRTKTSDLTDFFRSSHQSRHHTSNEEQASCPESVSLDVPHAPESSTALKRMTTRIPFLGRTRKKSSHSVKSSGLPSTPSHGYESSESVVNAKKDRRLSHPVSSPESVPRHPPPLPQINFPSSPTLSSKFAAHFGHPKARKLPLPARSSPAGTSESSASDTLLPPLSPRASSFDSGSSDTSANVPSTPRAGPTITVSLSPDNLDEYRDLFTLPRPKVTSQRRQSSTPASEYRDNYHKGDSNVTLRPSLPDEPSTELSDLTLGSQRELPRRVTESVQSNGPSKISKRRIPSTRRTEEADSSTEESVRNGRHNDQPNLPPVIDITPPPLPSKTLSSTPRSRLRSRASSSRERASQPPTIPLPPPPRSAPPLPPTSSPQPLSSPSASNALPPKRPRANTTGTPSSFPTSFPVTSPPTHRTPKDNAIPVKQDSDKENSDIDSMTVEQLRQALKTRNRQYEELSTHFSEATKAHAVDKAALEKKILTLEAEGSRKEKEIQGFTWMLNNRGLSGATAIEKGTIPSQVPSRIHRSPSTSSKLSSHIFQFTDDSGAESYQTSGAESVGASESSLSIRHKVRKPLILGEGYASYRPSKSTKAVSGGRGLGVDSSMPEMSVIKRSSVYSVSSATSSSSSLSASSGSPLSAIPESVMAPVRSTQTPSGRTTGTLSASDRENDGPHMSRASYRISTSSLASSSSTASSAYAANLKRGRPPSIAQVLEKSSMDDVMEKLRPFASSVTAGTNS